MAIEEIEHRLEVLLKLNSDANYVLELALKRIERLEQKAGITEDIEGNEL